MSQNRRHRIRTDLDAVLKRTSKTLRVMERILESEEELDLCETYADLVGLMQKLKRRRDDIEIGRALSAKLQSLTENLGDLFKKNTNKRKVRVIKIRGNDGASYALQPAIVGVEMAPPHVGENYLVIRQTGTSYFTSSVKKIVGNSIHTRNSVYQIKPLSTGLNGV